MCKLFFSIIAYFRAIGESILEFFWGLWYDRRREPIPNLDNDHRCLALSALELGRLIKDKELRSEDLVRACIERINQVNPILNAVVGSRYDDAIREAREVDERVARGLRTEDYEKPFLGVPFTCKESQAVRGLSLTYGLWSRRNERATEDCEAVRRMREAGAIPLAVTNLPELLIWNETRNPVYYTTKNPHHTGRSPGGSSGGEAALMASYATPISLTSDVAGSTRIPAFNCGLFGYHPTADCTNLKGLFDRTGFETGSMFSLGFISRHVDDQAPLMKIVAGDKAPLLNLDRQISMKDIKIYYTESFNDFWISPLTSDVKNNMKNVINRLETTQPTENSPRPYYHKAFDDAVDLWRYWMAKEPEDWFNWYTNKNGSPWLLWELFTKCIGFNRHSLNLIMRLAGLRFWPAVKSEWAEPLTRSLQDDLFSKLGDNGVLILPSSPLPAPYHYFPYVGPYNFGYYSIVNVMRCPAVQVPIGMNNKRIPLGIQVVAAPHNDALCLTVAQFLEKEYGGAVTACQA